MSWVNLKPTCKVTPGHQRASTNTCVRVFSSRWRGECTVCSVHDCDTSAHTQEEVTHLGCTFLVASLVARKGDRSSAGFAGGI